MWLRCFTASRALLTILIWSSSFARAISQPFQPRFLRLNSMFRPRKLSAPKPRKKIFNQGNNDQPCSCRIRYRPQTRILSRRRLRKTRARYSLDARCLRRPNRQVRALRMDSPPWLARAMAKDTGLIFVATLINTCFGAYRMDMLEPARKAPLGAPCL